MTQYSQQTHRRVRHPARPSRCGWWYWLCRWFGVLGLTVLCSLPVAAQSPAIPLHWIRYGELVSHQFKVWLADPANETVVRLYAAFEDGCAKSGAATPAVGMVVRVWVAADGRVERLEFPSLGNAQADADLRTVLTMRSLPKPPPPDMRQPMALQLSLGDLMPPWRFGTADRVSSRREKIKCSFAAPDSSTD